MSKETVYQVRCDRCKRTRKVPFENGIPENWIKFTLQDLDDPHWYHLCKECTNDHNNFMEGSAVAGTPSEAGLGEDFGFGAMG